MSNDPGTSAARDAYGRPPAAAAPPLNGPLDVLATDATALARELERAHAQLQLVFEIMACVADQRDADEIEHTLLRRYAGLLHASALFMDSAGCCRQIHLQDGAAPEEVCIPTDRVRAVLGPHVEAVRHSRRALVTAFPAEAQSAGGPASVLLATLPQPNGETGVVVTLRDAAGVPFDVGDVLACETALACGAHALHNAAQIRDMQRTAVQTVWALVNAIDAKDNYTSDHSERVGGLARVIGEALGLPKPRLQALEWAGLLHDVGKIGVSEQILNKPGLLTATEATEMRKHPRIGFDVLRPVGQFATVLDAVLYHHENHDGSGYPDGRCGEQIPLDARIVHVVDIFDALTSSRPYRRAHDPESALAMLEDEAGHVTDPDVTRLFVETLRNYMVNQPTAFRARFAQFVVPPAGRG
jgi:HD-GYP domain-containing protein (c-di-GMP phosphodiesterase class II)